MARVRAAPAAAASSSQIAKAKQKQRKKDQTAFMNHVQMLAKKVLSSAKAVDENPETKQIDKEALSALPCAVDQATKYLEQVSSQNNKTWLERLNPLTSRSTLACLEAIRDGIRDPAAPISSLSEIDWENLLATAVKIRQPRLQFDARAWVMTLHRAQEDVAVELDVSKEVDLTWFAAPSLNEVEDEPDNADDPYRLLTNKLFLPISPDEEDQSKGEDENVADDDLFDDGE